MKRILSATLACLLLVSMVIVLASCGGGLSGTYEASKNGETQTLVFKGDTLTITMTDGEETETIKYTYTLNEDQTKISLTMAEDDVKDMLKANLGEDVYNALDAETLASYIANFTTPNEMAITIADDSVEIGGMKYTKK